MCEGWRLISAVDNNNLSQHFIAKLSPSPFPTPVKNTMATETGSHFPTQPTHFHDKISSCWSSYWWLMSYKTWFSLLEKEEDQGEESKKGDREEEKWKVGGVKGRLTWTDGTEWTPVSLASEIFTWTILYFQYTSLLHRNIPEKTSRFPAFTQQMPSC